MDQITRIMMVTLLLLKETEQTFNDSDINESQ